MAEIKKYVSLDKLTKYDAKIKQVISAGDAATLDAAKDYADGLATNYDAAGSAGTVQTNLETEIARAQAKETELANANTATQAEVDALELKVGTVPEGSADVIAYINKKTEGIATDTALAELQEDVNTVTSDVATIKGDYLKAADKTELTQAIETEAARADAAEKVNAGEIAAIKNDYLKTADKEELQDNIDTVSSGLAAVKEDVDAFFLDADMTENAKDTLKELQQYIASDETAASQMAASIKQNADAIDAVESRMDTAEGKIQTAEGKITANEQAIAAIQTAVGEGGSVDEKIAAAVKVETDARVKAIEEVQADADKGIADAAAAQGTANEAKTAAATAQSEVDALELVVAEKAAQADLTALAGRVTNAEGKISTLETEMNAVEALAAANKTAHEANAAAIALKADKTALEAEVTRAKAAEEANAAAIAAFTEVSEEEINNLFQQA